MIDSTLNTGLVYLITESGNHIITENSQNILIEYYYRIIPTTSRLKFDTELSYSIDFNIDSNYKIVFDNEYKYNIDYTI